MTLTGGGVGYDNTASIRQLGAGSSQSLTAASLAIQGGSGNGTGGSTGDCGPSCDGYAASNNAGIFNLGSGGQTINVAGGSISVIGGTVGNRNNAYIQNRAASAQTITAASMYLQGGDSGGMDSFEQFGQQSVFGTSWLANNASISSGWSGGVTGSQNITIAGAIAVKGNSGAGSNGQAGAGIAATGSQVIHGGAITVMGGGGSGVYKSAAGIISHDVQSITADSLSIQGGVGGHDNGASLIAHGDQTINLTGIGNLELTGGSGAGSYNNRARIQHGYTTYGGNVYSGSGDQTINLAAGSNVIITAGSGNGTGGDYDPACFAVLGAACQGGSNGASIENGIGNQTLNFAPGGALTLTGGSAGTQNWAGLENKGGSQAVYGSPNITLTGGSGGGDALPYYGYLFEQSNDAGIFTKGTGGQWITAGTLTIDGGTADWGGAGISNESGVGGMTILTTGNLSMLGGSSNAAGPHAAAAYIGSMAAGLIDIHVGGDLHIQAGSGTSAPALIGSVDGAADIHITTATGYGITMVAAASDVAIGAKSSGHGAHVVMESGGDITASSTGPAGKVLIGSDTNILSATNVALNARGDISLDPSTLVGVVNPGAYGFIGAVRMVAGWDGVTGGLGAQANTLASYGSIMISGSMVRTGGGGFGAYASDDVHLGNIETDAIHPGNQGGAVTATANNGALSATSISARGADGGYGYSGGDGGNVMLWAKGNVTIESGGIDASGGTSGATFGYGISGGNGGNVTITSLTGQINVNGDIKANGGQGGDGSTPNYGYADPGGAGGMGGSIGLYGGSLITLGAGKHLNANGGQGGQGGDDGGYGAGNGGNGGDGGTVFVMSSGDKISLQPNSQINAYGGVGGQGGAGQSDEVFGSFLTVSGDDGATGGQGGAGGSIILTANSTASDAIALNNGILNASGGMGGMGGVGGGGNAFSSYGGAGGFGGDGGNGGGGGDGGSIQMFTPAANGGIQLGSATLRVNGGHGGMGGDGGVGKGYSVTAGYGEGFGGDGGEGGQGGAGGSSPGILVSGGSGGISLNGAVLEARGGNGGVAGVAGDGFGFDGGVGGTSNGNGSAGNQGGGGSGRFGGLISLGTSLGDIVSLVGGGTLDVGGGSGQDGTWGGWGENGGTIELTTSSGGSINLSAGTVVIKADGGVSGHGSDGDARFGGDGGTVNFSAHGGIAVGAISAVGGRGGNGFLDGGYGGDGGHVALVSYGGIAGAGIATAQASVSMVAWAATALGDSNKRRQWWRWRRCGIDCPCRRGRRDQRTNYRHWPDQRPGR